MNQIEQLASVYKALVSIAETQGSNAKIEQAIKVKDTPLLRRVVFMSYAKQYNFFIRKIPEPQSSMFAGVLDYKYEPMQLLEALSSREISGLAAIDEVTALLDGLDSESKEAKQLIINILDRNLRAGIAAKGWNKVFGADFLPEVPCMKAREMNDKNLANIEFPAWAQIKYDGTRMIYTKRDDVAVLQSRNGSKFYFIEELESYTNEQFEGEQNVMVDGEIVFVDVATGTFLDRKTSNGYANRCIKAVNRPPETVKPVYKVWDIVIDNNPTRQYKERWEDLCSWFQNTHDVVIADFKTVYSLDEARDAYIEALAQGEEGIILKNICAPWTHNRSKHLVKFKEVIEVDLRALEMHYGKKRSKYEKSLGYITFGSDDGSILVDVGSGYSDADRDHIVENWDTEFKDTVATIKCNALIEDKNNRKTKSLFLPTMNEWRVDKDETNSASDF